MAAALLRRGTTAITNVPDILDVAIMAELLRRLGLRRRRTTRRRGGTVDHRRARASRDHQRRLRPGAPHARVDLRARPAGRPLSARADVALPGGDAIGSRGLDMHIAGLRAARRRRSPASTATWSPRRPSGCTGADDLAGLPERRGHREHPHGRGARRGRRRSSTTPPASRRSSTSAEMLIAMGAQHRRRRHLDPRRSTGVDALHPSTHATVPDRIVGRHLGGRRRDDPRRRHRARRRRRPPGDRAGQARDGRCRRSTVLDDGFRVRWTTGRARSTSSTLPYPGFPTDLQPQFIALNAVADGTAMVTENLFEARFRFVNELVAPRRRRAHRRPPRRRPRAASGSPARRSRPPTSAPGAGLVLAGLVAEGDTTVYDVHHIDRGYAGLRREPRGSARSAPAVRRLTRHDVDGPWTPGRLPSDARSATGTRRRRMPLRRRSGLMGSGIAQVSAVAGHDVVLRDLTPRPLARGLRHREVA